MDHPPRPGGFWTVFETEIMTVATGAAGSLVAAIATWGTEKMRTQVKHFFRHATPEQQTAAIQAVDDTAARLSSDHADSQAATVDAWIARLAQYLTEHHDAMAEIDDLATPPITTSKTWNQHNHSTGTFIGGDVHGGVTFNFGGASDGGR